MNHSCSLGLKALALAAATYVLTACSNLQDVNHVWCPPEAQPKTVSAPIQERITLKADALFRYNKSDLANMLPQDRAQLDALADLLNTDFARIDQLNLVGYGHTDRLGSDAYNQRLSQARTQTVMRYLQSKGVKAPMQALGKGEREPSGQTAHCLGQQPTPQLTNCLQPDRRVEVLVQGQRR